MLADPISDYLTRIRNGIMAEKKVVSIPSSNIKKEITKILHDQGYIVDYKFEDKQNNQGEIKIALKYDKQTNVSVIKFLQRVSKPSFRRYYKSSQLPRVLNGLGIAIISTSKGLMTDKEARKSNLGGEVLCYVY